MLSKDIDLSSEITNLDDDHLDLLSKKITKISIKIEEEKLKRL